MKEDTLPDNVNLEALKEYLLIQGYSTGTRASFIQALLRFVQWSLKENIELTDISYNDILAYVNHCKSLGNKQNTIRANLRGVTHYYNFLLSREEITDNPCSNINLRGVKRKMLYETFTPEELEVIYNNYTSTNQITFKRNKVILGLVIYQGLKTEEFERLTTQDIKLREGKIFVAGARRSNARELKLEAHQIIDLSDYMNETRKILLMMTSRQTDKLFMSTSTSERFSNMLQILMKQLRRQDKRIRDVKQLRASVITNWLKIYDVRRVQHMAGHRYVSSTEGYQANNMEGLIDDVNKYHPNF